MGLDPKIVHFRAVRADGHVLPGDGGVAADDADATAVTAPTTGLDPMPRSPRSRHRVSISKCCANVSERADAQVQPGPTGRFVLLTAT